MLRISHLSNLLQQNCPNVDPIVIKYCIDKQAGPEAIEQLGQILLSAGAGKQFLETWIGEVDREIESFRSKLGHTVSYLNNLSLDDKIKANLANPVACNLETKISLDRLATKVTESRVDKKKLEKAEAKIKAKWEKRIIKADYEVSKITTTDERKKYEDFYTSVNPFTSISSRNKNKDIKLEMINLSFGSLQILTDASLKLYFGRKYGLVGMNGVGKSTLLRALSRREINIPPLISILHVEQEVTGDDTPVLQAVLEADVWRTRFIARDKEINCRLEEISQILEDVKDDSSIDQSLVLNLERERNSLDSELMTIHQNLADIESEKAESQASAILAGLGFSNEAQKHPTKHFSGGWRMRVALARALFCKPDLLLLDEPSNMLDVPSMAFLSLYLREYKSTVLVVLHDRIFLDEIATDIIHQHSQRLDYYKGNFSAFYCDRLERQKRLVNEYEKQMEYRKHLQTFIDKFRYNAAKAGEAQSRIKKLEKLPKLDLPESETEVIFKFPTVQKISPPILQMNAVSFGYDKQNLILTNVDITVDMDSRIGLMGPNGSGKSTLLKLLINEIEPIGGNVSRHPRLKIGYFAQHHVDQMDLSQSALGFVMRKFPGMKEEEYRRELGSFGISGPLALQRMSTLSGGQKSRVAFACLGLTRPHVLVLDEPTNHLDIQAMNALFEAIKAYKGGVIMVSHNIAFLDSACNSYWICENKQVTLFTGTVMEYKNKIAQEAMKRFKE